MPVASGYIRTSYAKDMMLVSTRFRRLMLALGVVVLLLYPFYGTRYALNIVNLTALATVGAVALNLLTGVGGQVSMGNAAFLAVGAFVAASLGAEAGLPFPLVIGAGAVVAGVVGVVVGIPALRFRGLYLVIATLALHYIVIFVVQRYQIREVGATGFLMKTPVLFGYEISSPTRWYYFLVFCASASIVLVLNLTRSRYGRAWMAIRDRDIAAEILGVPVGRYKLILFGLTSAIIGAQGAIFAYYVRVVESDTFTIDLAIQYVAMIIIGGMGSVLGSVLGAAFVTGLPFVVREFVAYLPPDLPGMTILNDNLFDVQNALYGVSIVAFLLFEPRGLAALWSRVRLAVYLWPFSRERLALGEEA